jgi:FkbM family methyltransferase
MTHTAQADVPVAPPAPPVRRSMVVSLPRAAHPRAPLGPYRRRLDMIDASATAVQRALRRTGLAGYEPSTQATLLTVMHLAGEGAVFFDIGAHVGLYAAEVAAIFADRDVRVLAFEPAPDTVRMAEEIRARNDLDYEVVPVALCDREGSATLYLSDKAETSNSMNPTFRASSHQVVVPTTTVDAFVAARGIVPTLVKIDVETLESTVLAGALDLIRSARPWIVCELLRPSEDLSGLLREIAGYGYTYHHLAGDPPWPARPPRVVLDEVGGPDRDWLFAPSRPGPRFHATASGWLTAIAACDATTNLIRRR